MKDKPLILAIKGDARQEYAIAALKGYFKTQEASFPLTGAGAADILLLPMLTHTGSFAGVERLLAKNALILGGRIPKELRESFEAGGYEVIDYYDSEVLKIKNALPTAEAALKLAIENTEGVLSGGCVLVTGFGACGEQIARLFSLMGCKTLVCARSSIQRAKAQVQGFKALALTGLAGAAADADIIINTVPARLFGGREVRGFKESAVYIEIASYPYGIDDGAAKALGKRFIAAPALPAKYSPKASGEYIAEAVRDIIKQRSEGEN